MRISDWSSDVCSSDLLGVMLLFLGVAICFAPTLVPPFLDRVYYDGPTSGHYDGERFFNLGGTAAAVEAHERGRFDLLFHSWMGAGAEWPERIAVTPTVQHRRVAGGALRVTWIAPSDRKSTRLNSSH